MCKNSKRSFNYHWLSQFSQCYFTDTIRISNLYILASNKFPISYINVRSLINTNIMQKGIKSIAFIVRKLCTNLFYLYIFLLSLHQNISFYNFKLLSRYTIIWHIANLLILQKKCALISALLSGYWSEWNSNMSLIARYNYIIYSWKMCVTLTHFTYSKRFIQMFVLI